MHGQRNMKIENLLYSTEVYIQTSKLRWREDLFYWFQQRNTSIDFT